MRKMLDILTAAVTRYRTYGRRGIMWEFDTMSAEERLTFDLWLVRTSDELAYHAGTTEARFTARVLAMALSRPAVSMGLIDLS